MSDTKQLENEIGELRAAGRAIARKNAFLERENKELRSKRIDLEMDLSDARGQLAAVTQRAVAAETDAARLRLYVAELEALLPADARARAAERAAAKLEEMGEE